MRQALQQPGYSVLCFLDCLHKETPASGSEIFLGLFLKKYRNTTIWTFPGTICWPPTLTRTLALGRCLPARLQCWTRLGSTGVNYLVCYVLVALSLDHFRDTLRCCTTVTPRWIRGCDRKVTQDRYTTHISTWKNLQYYFGRLNIDCSYVKHRIRCVYMSNMIFNR